MTKIFVEENIWVAAMKFEAVNEIEFLLHRGLRLDTKILSNGSNWMLPIHLATKHYHIEMLDILIKNEDGKMYYNEEDKQNEKDLKE